MMDLCVKCKVKPVHVKSRGLCLTCVAKFYTKRARKRQGKPVKTFLSKYRENKVRHGCEVDFIKNFFEHKNWIYQPALFRLNGCSYQPDFYDGNRNVFIEISGTRQAFYHNREKYRLFIKTYPKINLEIRRANGDLIPISDAEGTFHEKK